jgi:catechol 2,3-dioxygenase-like lactoylglutathione lyase family enzyme
MKIKKLDHLVLTVNDIDMTITFYTDVLDMTVAHTAAGRKSLRFGKQKINLHKAGQEISPHAMHPLPGSADICFLTETSMQQVIEHLNFHKITILAGPAERVGATGPLLSIYIQDPDGNLIEISNQIDK